MVDAMLADSVGIHHIHIGKASSVLVFPAVKGLLQGAGYGGDGLASRLAELLVRIIIFHYAGFARPLNAFVALARDDNADGVVFPGIVHSLHRGIMVAKTDCNLIAVLGLDGDILAAAAMTARTKSRTQV